jgi:hypothetical protein
MAFKQTSSASVMLWSGNPNCEAAHAFLRDHLRMHAPAFPTAWSPQDTRTQGNLGETIAFCVGTFSSHAQARCFPANATHPFSGISRNGIDLLWIGFGEFPNQDFAIHQEVKTTTKTDLKYAEKVLDDYQKAFGSDPRFTLNTHLHEVKTKLIYEHHRPDLAKRVTALQAINPASAQLVRAIPTLVYDLTSTDAAKKMTAIEEAMKAAGWTSVTPWAIGLRDLQSRLQRIAGDKP